MTPKPTAVLHVPACNDRCNAEGHYLLAAHPDPHPDPEEPAMPEHESATEGGA